jgi:hypothetical protein
VFFRLNFSKLINNKLMKRLLLYLPLFAAMATTISCQKQINGDFVSSGGTGTSVNGVLKMKIDGVPWVADKVASASIISNVIAIAGLSNTRKTLVIRLNEARTGKFLLAPDSMHVGALSDSTENPFSYGTNEGIDTTESVGEVIVSSIDATKKTISGTFKLKVFRLLDSKTRIITEGVFDNLSYATTLPPANTTDTFTVKIDGVTWKPQSIAGATTTLTGQLAIVATDATGAKAVGLTMPVNITAGTYDLDFFGLTYFGQYNPNGTTFLPAQSGKMTILEHNTSTKRIRGNFNFVGKDLLASTTAQLTEGYFSVKYQ